MFVNPALLLRSAEAGPKDIGPGVIDHVDVGLVFLGSELPEGGRERSGDVVTRVVALDARAQGGERFLGIAEEEAAIAVPGSARASGARSQARRCAACAFRARWR